MSKNKVDAELENQVIEIAASAAAVAANKVIEDIKNPDPFSDNPFTMRTPPSSMNLYDVCRRPDSPIKQTVLGYVREEAKNPTPSNGFNNGRIDVSAKWDGDDVKVAIAPQPRPNNEPSFCRDRNLFNVQQQRKQEEKDVTTIRVTRDEAKSFFGTEPVKLAKETGKVINRTIFSNDL